MTNSTPPSLAILNLFTVIAGTPTSFKGFEQARLAVEKIREAYIDARASVAATPAATAQTGKPATTQPAAMLADPTAKGRDRYAADFHAQAARLTGRR